MLTNYTDAELISLFVNEKNEHAFDTLLRRYYNQCYQRFYRHLRDEHLSHDLCQKLWMRLLNNLPQYQDNNKFEHYLNKIISNLLKDEWRQRAGKQEFSIHDESAEFMLEQETSPQNKQGSLDKDLNLKQAVDELINNLIPLLPCEQRLVFLLRHESEYWDDKQPLQWQHVAELNKLEIDQAYRLFETCRDKLMVNTTHKKQVDELSCEEKLIFLLWTQSQRLDKTKKYTEQYFANLLNMSVNTFKTKYRAGIKSLSAGLEQWK